MIEKDTTSKTEDNRLKQRSMWKITGKIVLWTAGVIIGLILLIMCAVAWILTPERLTPLVEKYASEYLKADVKVDRVELTVWRSFPYVELDVDNLRLVSRSLQGQPDTVLKALPADASRLLDAQRMHGSINPWSMLRGCIKIGDISIDGLGINLVSYAPGINNFDIMPPSEPSEESKPWRYELGHITVNAQGGIRYFDAASGMYILLHRPGLEVFHDDDKLTTDFKTAVDMIAQGHKYVEGMPVTLKGEIGFKQEPMDISVSDLKLTVWGVGATIDFGLDMSSSPVLTKCIVSVPPLRIMPLLRLAAPSLIADVPALQSLDTDISLGIDATVNTPWQLTSPSMPDVNVKFNVPPCDLTYTVPGSRDKISITDLELKAAFDYVGKNPEASALHVSLFRASGAGVDISMDADVTELLSQDPMIRISSKGQVDMSRFSPLIPIKGSRLSGVIDADASIKCLLSDISHLRLQNIDADGSLEIRGLLLSLPLLTTELYARLATFTFGNSMSDKDLGAGMVTGMLRAHADIDTLYCSVPGITLGIRGLGLRAGTTPAMLASTSSDQVMPLGLKLMAQRVVADSPADTMHVNMRGLTATGKVTRYEGNARSPLLETMFSADRVRYTDPLTRLGVRGFSAEMQAHLRKRKSDKTPYQRRYDAIARANPGLSADSVAALASAPRRRLPADMVVDMSVDNGLKALIRQWGVQGSVRADRMNFTYIQYPVRTRITNLALDFSLDSLRLHRAYIVSQNNRLSVAGTVSNMRYAMLGRTRTPLRVRLFTDIDSIDINLIAYNYELGRGLQAKRGVLARINPEDEDALVRAAAEAAVPGNETVDTMPLIVPRNIDAQISLSAREAVYTNIALHGLQGKLVVNDGAVSIDSLVSGTDFGQAYLNLLYSSRDPQDLNMSVDLGFNRVNLSDFYTTFPQVVELMPMITNLSGMVGASLTGSFDMFPNMDIDFGSINAVLNISGSNLTVAQDPLIRKVARMMLIRKKGDLNISDMNIQVALHDNVMRLYPFAFSMEKYKFALLGENDLDQNMYYHLSVLKSPIPWKFGINIKGTFDKPKFRFGGAKYKENEAREVVNLVQSERVNFVRAMRLQLRKLVHRAALNYADRTEPDQSRERLDQSMTDTQYSDPTQMMGESLAGPIAKALGKNAGLLRTMQQKGKKTDKKQKK